MTESMNADTAEVFISYASHDRDRVLALAHQLEAVGVRLWVDRDRIEGGANYGPEIVRGIKGCKVLMLMCSDAALRSRNVKQEIQLAWKYARPYLPLLLEPVSFDEQIEYWLEGFQWIEVLAAPPAQWLPQVLRALARAGVQFPKAEKLAQAEPIIPPTRLAQGWQGLRSLARFTDQIWPLPAGTVQRGLTRAALRDLGEDPQYIHRLGSRVWLAIESDRAGHLLLLDEGTSGKLYCLCPSQFAPDTRLMPGSSYLPQVGARYDAFVVSGRPGREHLLAIISDEPLGLDWMPTEPRHPARVLTPADIEALLVRLRNLEGNKWTALSTYFDVIA